MSKIKYQLTPRELDIMNILWKSSQPLIALDIVNTSDGITMNTVQATLKKLLNRKFIRVADVVYSGNKLSRSYEAAITAEEYEAQRVFHTMKDSDLHAFSASGFIAAFLNQETDMEATHKNIRELEKLLKEKREELNHK